MRIDPQIDDHRIEQRYRWLMKNGWADDSGKIVVLYKGKRYRPGLGMRDAYLKPTKKGHEEIVMPIFEYYDLVMSMQIIHPEDKPKL